MEKTKEYTSPYEMDGRIPWPKAIVYGLQHVLAMFVGNLTPLIVICGACGIGAASDFAEVYVELLQNAMIIAGVVTLVQLFAIGPVGGRVPIIMGTSSGFIGVFKSVAGVMGGGVIAYGAIMGASIIGGLFEGVLGFFLKPLRRFFPAVVTGTVVLSIGLSLISVGVSSFGGGSSAADYGSLENLFIGLVVLIIILGVKHFAKGMASSSSILIGIIAGYVLCFIMGMILPTTAVNADGVEYTKAWVLNWDKVAAAAWFAIPNPCLGVLDTIGVNACGGQHQPHDARNDIADDDTNQNGRRADEARRRMLHRQDDDEDDKRQAQVFGGTEISRAVAAAERVDADADEAQSDRKDDSTRHDGREEAAQRLQEEAQHAFKNTADDGCAHDRAIGQHTAAHRAHNAVEHTNKAGAGAHNDRHCAAHGSDGKQLHQRDDTCHEHGALQQGDLQVCKLAACNAAGAGNDQQRGQVAHEHGADMLQAQRDGLTHGHFGFKLISRFFKLEFLQKFHSPQGFKGLCGSDALQKSENIIAKCR